MTSVTPAILILLRHGQSQWNASNQFTGWYDCDLTPQGEAEAQRTAQWLTQANVLPDVIHTSLQTRAIRTAELALAQLGRSWIPAKRHWRLNERHYGNLTGLDKAKTRQKYGDEQLLAWRRGYRTPPPPIADDNPWNPNFDARYANLTPDQIPQSECLADVVARLMPYWYDAIVPDLQAGHTVMVSAHGNSLRALAMHLDQIPEDEIAGLNIPTGMPLVYELSQKMMPLEAKATLARSLDPVAATKAAEAVAKQAG
ncbi:MAG: 2,3-diphosphoglycerate-dependent phosphoglycerate mutase [bacterium]|nr:2,3-diphosphoglycerate-dependent phosphoglycerate mutase [bacterium]MCY4258614.1 2,3-diphosphoglycerate-dependent phosphoglycerate mutase [bacterium]